MLLEPLKKSQIEENHKSRRLSLAAAWPRLGALLATAPDWLRAEARPASGPPGRWGRFEGQDTLSLPEQQEQGQEQEQEQAWSCKNIFFTKACVL